MRFHHSVTWFRNGYMVSTFSYEVSLFGYAVLSFRYAVSSLCGSYALCASSPNKKGRFRKVFRKIFEKKKISKDIICELSLEDFRTLGFVDRNDTIKYNFTAKYVKGKICWMQTPSQEHQHNNHNQQKKTLSKILTHVRSIIMRIPASNQKIKEI